MAHLIQKSGKAASEKSNFAQTCNLLSRYLKERVSFNGISHGISSTNPEPNKGPETVRTPATTLNLLLGIENPSEKTNIKPVDFLPHLVPNFTCSTPVSDKTSDLRKSSAPMTIFYNGQVMVFDDFPAEKVKEIVALATKTTSNSVTNGFNASATSAMDKPNENSNIIAPAPNTKVMEGIQLQAQSDSDLPIARRASLHRFLEKRKDRVASKAPYQINNASAPSSSSARPRPAEQRDIVIIDLECPPSKDSKEQLDLSL